MLKLCFSHFTIEEFDDKIQELNDSFITQSSDNKSSKLKKDKSLDLLTEILRKSSNSELQSRKPHILIACAIKLLIKYSNTPLHYKIEIPEEKRKSRYHLVKDNYIKLLEILVTKEPEEIIKSVINAMHSEKIWKGRRVCIDMITALFESGYNGSVVCHEICNKIELTDKTNKLGMKLIVKVLYELLDNYDWPENEETVLFLERLLHFYYESSVELEDAMYINLRGSLELCVRHIIPKISNKHILIIIQHMSSWSVEEHASDNVILNYGSTLEYAAYMHKADSFVNTLTTEILSLIMQMIGSQVRFVSLLGTRVLQHLIDRGQNQMTFNTPKIFFENMRLALVVKECNREDRKFLTEHREIIHDNLIKSIINHRGYRLNLETTYCTICLLTIEIPCGFTAAALCCLMMNLQEIVMKQQEKIGRQSSYHIHAIIVSVLSFICWVHSAHDFHDYVMKIVMERAQWAPHLNPPLQSRYNFAVHHVLWDKPELFLVDWEVRYGLWRRFRLTEPEETGGKRVVYADQK